MPFLLVALAMLVASDTVGADAARLRPLSCRVDDGFWSPRMEVNCAVTIPHILAMCELEGRVRNMLRAGGRLDGPFEGFRHHDADLFKVVEAASQCLIAGQKGKWTKELPRIVDAICDAQRPDGYLATFRTIGRPDESPRKSLELFAAGHLFDAAAAYREATGDRRLLEAACRFADLVDRTLDAGGRREVPSHPKVEAGLVRLYRATGEKRYLELARRLLEERGRADASGRKGHGRHAQDHLPVRCQEEAVGHVICGLFLCEGLFDVGIETGDETLIEAARRICRDAIRRKMYLTGGMGRAIDEEFTEAYDLDNRQSIGEGCQSAALARLCHRFLLRDKDAHYADVLERVLYNNLAAAVSLDGRRFYYVNRLSARPEEATGAPYRYPYHQTDRSRLCRFCLDRQPWFQVPCCPPNIAMTIASLGRYAYAQDKGGVYVNLYLGSGVEFEQGGVKFRLRQRTHYPWEGRIEITLTAAEPLEFDLWLRIPDWCRGLESMAGLYRAEPLPRDAAPKIEINDRSWQIKNLERGYVRLRQKWRNGDTILIVLPMEVRQVTADPRVAADAGRVAVQRGPLVYCVEAVDHGGRIRDLRLPDDARLVAQWRPDLLGGIVAVRGSAVRDDEGGATHPVSLLAVPYAVWCNREPGEMDVWLARVAH